MVATLNFPKENIHLVPAKVETPLRDFNLSPPNSSSIVRKLLRKEMLVLKCVRSEQLAHLYPDIVILNIRDRWLKLKEMT